MVPWDAIVETWTWEQGEPEMAERPWHWLLQGFLSLLLLAVGAGTMLLLAMFAEPPAVEQPQARPPKVEVADVQVFRNSVTLEVHGEVVPSREVVLSAEVAGRIVEMHPRAEAGRFVTDDPELVLIEIDPRDYEFEIRRLSSELDQSEGHLSELLIEEENTKRLVELARAQFELQESLFARRQRLYQGGSLTVGALEEAKQTRLTTENALATLENQARLLSTRQQRLRDAIALSTIQLERAQLDLERTKIHSPVNGVVIEDHVEQNDFVTRGTPLLTIEDTSRIEVSCKLTPQELYWVWAQRPSLSEGDLLDPRATGYELPRTPVTVSYDLAGRTYEWNGYLDRYEGLGLDPVTRTIPCRVVVEDPRDVRVRPLEGEPAESVRPVSGPPALVRGMFVGLAIQTQPQVELVALPKASLRPDGSVWWMDDDARVHRTQVNVAFHLRTQVLLHAAQTRLAPGMRVVTSPAAVLHNGQQVAVAHGNGKLDPHRETAARPPTTSSPR